MIVKADEADQKVCPMGLGSENGNRRYGDMCMAWRNAGAGYGFCGMCPVAPFAKRSANRGGKES